MTITAQFAIEYNRFLDPEGNPTQELPSFSQDHHHLIALYRMMTLTRLFDAKAVALQRTGKIGTYASTLGQEAVSIGIGTALQKTDVLCPFYREYGAQLMRGVKMSEILLYWGGDERGNQFANCPEDFPICVPIGTQLLHAAGVAAAFKLRKQARVAVATCGDGATSEGDFYEAMNLAGAWNLPVVFVINNNQWAISVPRSQQSAAKTLAQKSIAAGFAGEQVDGNDVIAVQYAMEKALAKARQGGGPSLIEAITYRLCDHTTADDANRYRPQADLKQAWTEDPILRLRCYLFNQKVWSEEQEKGLLAAANQEVEQAVQAYLATPLPSPGDMFDYHYAQLPHDLVEQRIDAVAVSKLIDTP